MRHSSSIVTLVCLLSVAGCKLVKTPSAEEAALAKNGGFDPAKMAAETWDTKVIPYFEKKALPLADILPAVIADANAAGAKYGHREKESSGPFTFETKLEGKITAAETTSRSGFVDVDTDGNGTADARVQIGPAVKGTAIRDALDYLTFSEFKNQIEWAQFGKAYNVYVNGQTLTKLSRDALVGKTIKATGAFPTPSAGELPLVTPVLISIE